MYTLSPLADDFDFARKCNFEVYYTLTPENVEKMIHPAKEEDIIFSPSYKSTADYLENLLRFYTQKTHIENGKVDIELFCSIKNNQYIRNLQGATIGIKVIWYSPDSQSWDVVFNNSCRVDDIAFDFSNESKDANVITLKTSLVE